MASFTIFGTGKMGGAIGSVLTDGGSTVTHIGHEQTGTIDGDVVILAVPYHAVDAGKRIVAAGGLDVGGIEYLEAADGRLVFYDVNANSNLRSPIGEAFVFDPFARLAEYLMAWLGAG